MLLESLSAFFAGTASECKCEDSHNDLLSLMTVQKKT